MSNDYNYLLVWDGNSNNAIYLDYDGKTKNANDRCCELAMEDIRKAFDPEEYGIKFLMVHVGYSPQVLFAAPVKYSLDFKQVKFRIRPDQILERLYDGFEDVTKSELDCN